MNRILSLVPQEKCGKKLRRPYDVSDGDGYVIREETVQQNGTIIRCRIWTKVPSSTTRDQLEVFFEKLEQKLHPIPEPFFDWKISGAERKEETSAIEISVVFHTQISKHQFMAKARIFRSCLKSAKILSNPLYPAQLRVVK